MLIVHLFNLDGRSDVKKALPLVNILSRIRSVVSYGRYTYSKTRHLQASFPVPLQPIFARATTAYSRIGELTTFVQSFALLEVVHALLGWVRSPVTTTTMQVASRLFLVWGITTQFPEVCLLEHTWARIVAQDNSDPCQPHLRIHGVCMVGHRSHPVHILCAQFAWYQLEPTGMAPLYDLLRSVSSRSILRSLPYPFHPPPGDPPDVLTFLPSQANRGMEH